MQTTDIHTVPEPTLRRLPWYLAYARLAQQQGVEVLSSTQIARDTSVEPSQVAKDLSYVKMSGRTRVGYPVRDLVETLAEFLGFREQHRAFLFGVGRLGAALIQDSGLQQYGLDIVAGFDAKYELGGTTINHVPIHHITKFPPLQQQMGVQIGILTVPVERAQEVADLMVENGVKAIWNFTPFRIHVPETIVVQNTSIYAHLALMFNRLAL